MLQIGSANHRSRKGIAARHGFDIVIPCHYVAAVSARRLYNYDKWSGLVRAARTKRRRYNLRSRNYINKSRMHEPFEIACVFRCARAPQRNTREL